MPESESIEEVRAKLREEVLQVTPPLFEPLALKIFRFQARYNPVYGSYIRFLGKKPEEVTSLQKIPFLPVSLFKKHAVVTGGEQASAHVFESSGTTGTETSRHFVSDLPLYEMLSAGIFEECYGPLEDYHILALLPSYLERNNSSLVYMVQHFMTRSASPFSGFYLDDFESLNKALSATLAANDGKKTLLIGVTFALLDWAETFPQALRGSGRLAVMETGGMKGRRKEMLRKEVHSLLRERLGLPSIHSEYGMTELLSQAYSVGEGIFRPSAGMRVLIRDITDPLTIRRDGQTGGVNVVDLGNLDSCSFIETSDLGRLDEGAGTFEIMGRLDNSDIRGCNLLYG